MERNCEPSGVGFGVAGLANQSFRSSKAFRRVLFLSTGGNSHILTPFVPDRFPPLSNHKTAHDFLPTTLYTNNAGDKCERNLQWGTMNRLLSTIWHHTSIRSRCVTLVLRHLINTITKWIRRQPAVSNRRAAVPEGLTQPTPST